jgi:hypothetical protein
MATLLVKRLVVQHDEIGVHIWTVRGWIGIRTLERRAQFVVRRRRTSPIVWRKGKGAIGICWARNTPILANVQQLEERAPSETEFCALPREERFGLTWAEFTETRHYRAVLAVPLRVGPAGAPRLRGVISVDVLVDDNAGRLDTLLRTSEFVDILSVCEDVLNATAGEA